MLLLISNVNQINIDEHLIIEKLSGRRCQTKASKIFSESQTFCGQDYGFNPCRKNIY